MAEARPDDASKRYMDETKCLYGILESPLSSRDWLAGGMHTLADVGNYTFVRARPHGSRDRLE